MARLTNYMAHKIIDHMLRGQAFTPPSTVYLALFASPSEEDLTAGTLTNELSGGAYIRKAVTLSAASGRITSNTANVDFDIATLDWSPITHIAISDAVTGGNLLLWGALPFTLNVDTGQILNFPVGNIGLEIE